MKIYLRNAKIILSDRVIEGYVVVEGGIVLGAEVGGPDTYERSVDLKGLYLSPGFVELHTHGAGGHDFMDGTVEAFIAAAKTHMEHGTTTLLPTLLAAGREEILRGIDTIRATRNAAEVLPYMPGLHMEGPYLNVAQKGAIDEKYIHSPVAAEYDEFLEYGKGVISRWTVAPELAGAFELGDRLRGLGILPSIGHSNAEYSCIKEAFLHGYTHVTHLYSSMSTIVRRGGFRYPGVIESAFCIPEMTVEIIADGCHLPVELLEMVYRLKGVEHTCLTCDSMRCAGQNVQESILGSLRNGRKVIIEDDVALLPDRSAFAGSTATDDRLVRVMHKQARIPLYDCVGMMTLTPADIIGLSHRKGSIAAGKDADLICFDKNIDIQGVMVGGKGVSGIFFGDF